MSGLSYETVARFAQQAGTLYFGLMFVVCLIYALWPKRRDEFERLAGLALEKDEDEHVQL